MLVLDGSVNIVHEDGQEEIFRAGDAFVIPKGLRCQWKQTESIHKFYVILDDPEAPVPDQPGSRYPPSTASPRPMSCSSFRTP